MKIVLNFYIVKHDTALQNFIEKQCNTEMKLLVV